MIDATNLQLLQDENHDFYNPNIIELMTPQVEELKDNSGQNIVGSLLEEEKEED